MAEHPPDPDEEETQEYAPWMRFDAEHDHYLSTTATRERLEAQLRTFHDSIRAEITRSIPTIAAAAAAGDIKPTPEYEDSAATNWPDLSPTFREVAERMFWEMMRIWESEQEEARTAYHADLMTWRAFEPLGAPGPGYLDQDNADQRERDVEDAIRLEIQEDLMAEHNPSGAIFDSNTRFPFLPPDIQDLAVYELHASMVAWHNELRDAEKAHWKTAVLASLPEDLQDEYLRQWKKNRPPKDKVLGQKPPLPPPFKADKKRESEPG